MKKYLPTLIAAILVGMTVSPAYAAGQGDVDDVTMNVIDNSNPQDVTNDIQLPTQANQEADDHVAGTVDDSDHVADDKTESHDNAAEDTNDDSQAAAQEDADEDSHAAAEEDAHQAMQDAADASDSKGD